MTKPDLKPISPAADRWDGYDHCQSARDGECIWKRCPQLLEGEPEKTGRHCPLDVADKAWLDANGEEYR